MISDLGARLRYIRSKKGFSLNSYAQKLDVSPAYLSNLETGKTDTIHLTLLQKLQDDLGLFPIENDMSVIDIEDVRIRELTKQLIETCKTHPEKTNHIIKIMEHALSLIK